MEGRYGAIPVFSTFDFARATSQTDVLAQTSDDCCDSAEVFLHRERRSSLAPVRSYTNWNSRTTDEEEQIEPYRKYFFICEGANTETWYFKKLIDIRKELNIHPLIDIRLLEKQRETGHFISKTFD